MPSTLFMVTEHFGPNLKAVGDRFKLRGRMLPDNVVYISSWMESNSARCFQLMEAPGRAALDPWHNAWSDLVRFEIAEVRTSAEYWAAHTG